MRPAGLLVKSFTLRLVSEPRTTKDFRAVSCGTQLDSRSRADLNFGSFGHFVATMKQWHRHGFRAEILGGYDDQAYHRFCAVLLHVDVGQRNRARCHARAELTGAVGPTAMYATLGTVPVGAA